MQKGLILAYPALYRAANSAAERAQKNYMHLMWAFLAGLILGAALSLLAGISSWLAILSVLTFATTIAISLLLAVKRYDRTWYDGRALAESVKTMTWRYVMRARPYNEGEHPLARAHLLNDLNRLLDTNASLCGDFPEDDARAEAFTSEMDRMRNLQVSKRLDLYNTNRVDEQRAWYTKRAGENGRFASRWFIAICLFQLLALASALLRIVHLDWSLLPTQVLAVTASAMLTWMQVKRFQDLATSYNLTAQDIGLIKANLPDVVDEKTLSDFVENAESAFSREHTEWLARRTVRR